MSWILCLVSMALLYPAKPALASADVPGHGGTRASLKVRYDFTDGKFETVRDKDRYKVKLLKDKAITSASLAIT